MTEVFDHPEHADFWVSAWRGEPVDWDGVLGDYGATLDWPACTFYEELMKRHPDAKVILTVRDPERWYESARTTIYELSKTIRSPVSRMVFSVISLLTFGGFAGRRTTLPDEIIWDGTFDVRFEDKDYAIRVFEGHNEEVKRKVPPEKLLVYEVGEGWGPLCEFLDVEEPDEPFPRLNDADEIRRGVTAIRAISAAVPYVPVLLGLAIFALLRRRARS